MSTDSFVPQVAMEGLEIRYTVQEDSESLKSWLKDPDTAVLFPVGEEREIEDASVRWVSFCKDRCCLSADYMGSCVGLGILFVQTYTRLKHQATQILVVAKDYRQMGIGTALLGELERLASENFQVELLHVEVYDDTFVAPFYQKRGYAQFARQECWTKEEGIYRPRICLEKFI